MMWFQMNPFIELQETDRISDSLQAETTEGELESEATVLESDTVIDGTTSVSDVEFSDSDTDDLAENLLVGHQHVRFY